MLSPAACARATRDCPQIPETRDFQSTSHRIHGEMPRMQPRCAGQESRFGVIDHLGKTHYLAQRYGTAEALGGVIERALARAAARNRTQKRRRRSR